MVTIQSAVSIITEVLPHHEEPLRELLQSAGRDQANNPLMPFGLMSSIHFTAGVVGK